MKKRLAIGVLILLSFNTDVIGQSDPSTQFWWDATYYRPFAVSFRKIASFGTRHLIGSDEWHKVFVKGALEWYPIPFIDLMTELVYMNTLQKEDFNTVEWRPDIGFRMNFLQQRMTFRTNTRLEFRNVRYRESGDIDRSVRLRARVELLVPLNNPSKRDPKTLYALTDFEVFADVAGDEVEERFSDTNRFRLGLGWRQDREWRFELIYTRQNSRNTLDQEFENSDNIIRIRIKFQPLRGQTKKELKEQPHH